MGRPINYLAGAAILCLSGATSATLIGDSVEGGFVWRLATVEQFVSPAIVGAGPEFAGVLSDPFDQIWDVVVDIGASSFIVDFTERTRDGDGNIERIAPDNLLEILLSDLDWIDSPRGITDVSLSDYSCASLGFSCRVAGGGPSVKSLTFDDNSISTAFNVLRDGETYTFVISNVPEPSTLALISLGLVGLGVARRKKKASLL